MTNPYPHKLGAEYDCTKSKCPVHWQRHPHFGIHSETTGTVFPCGNKVGMSQAFRFQRKFRKEMQYHPLMTPSSVGGLGARKPCEMRSDPFGPVRGKA